MCVCSWELRFHTTCCACVCCCCCGCVCTCDCCCVYVQDIGAEGALVLIQRGAGAGGCCLHRLCRIRDLLCVLLRPGTQVCTQGSALPCPPSSFPSPASLTLTPATMCAPLLRHACDHHQDLRYQEDLLFQRMFPKDSDHDFTSASTYIAVPPLSADDDKSWHMLGFCCGRGLCAACGRKRVCGRRS